MPTTAIKTKHSKQSVLPFKDYQRGWLGYIQQRRLCGGAFKLQNQLSLYSHAGTGYIMFHNDGVAQNVQVTYSDLSGNLIYSETRSVTAGDNSWIVPRDKVKEWRS